MFHAGKEDTADAGRKRRAAPAERGWEMSKLSESKREEILRAYFEDGLEETEIAGRLGVSLRSVSSVLRDQQLLEPYIRRSEAAKLRAQICVNENAEEAARRQAALLHAQTTDTISQRAAKDILDRAGVRVAKEEKSEVRITFVNGAPKLGMPRRGEESDGD